MNDTPDIYYLDARQPRPLMSHITQDTSLPGPNPLPGYPPMPDPTPEQVNDPMFLAIWKVIKSWDVSVPEYYFGYMGATGSHVMLLLNAIEAVSKRAE